MQAAYDGAALVYARNQALSYMGISDPPGHAKITTFTSDGKNINFFAHYAAESEHGTLVYHQCPINSIIMVNSYEEYKEGRKYLRNAQDHAKRQSEALRDQLKEYHKKQRGGGLHPIAEGVPPLSVPDLEPPDTMHAYEDEDDCEVVEPQPFYQPPPPTSSRSKHGQTRKGPSSQGSSSGSSYHSKYKSYWKKDAMSGRYYHKYSDGTVSWLDDDEEDECD